MIFLILWLVSCFLSLIFIPWCIDRGYSPIVILIMFCPILNTIFVICRTYHAVRSGFVEGWESFKDLFAK